MTTKRATRPAEPSSSQDTNHTDAAQLPIAESGDAILALDDRTLEVVDVPEWGMRVTIQSLTGDERDVVDEWVLAHRNDEGQVKQAGFRAFLVAVTAVNSAGELLFTPEQAAVLGRKNHKAIARLADASQRLSKLNESDVDEAADDLGKDQSSASGTS